MGTQRVSLRNGSWRGQTTHGMADVGERRFIRIRNGYVSADGSEIRQWPGSFTLLDLSENNSLGYDRYTNDSVLPLFATTPTQTYQLNWNGLVPSTNRQTLQSRARPAFWHCFEQIQNQLIIVGESRFRESPILTSGRVVITITAVADVAGLVEFTLSGAIGSYSVTDATGAGRNGVSAESVVYVERIVLTNGAPGEQALIDAGVNNRVHRLNTAGGIALRLAKTAIGLGGTRTATGQVHVVSCNRNDTYSAAAGISPYEATLASRIDDATSLTSWRVIAPLAPRDSRKTCFPAWVANRQRDFGDLLTGSTAEGMHFVGTTIRGVSRREKLELPFRLNPEPAADRLILAAPGYGCMFQVPMKVPFDPEDLGRGIPVESNDQYDKPRSLGVPKARLIASYNTTAPTSPAQNLTNGFNQNLVVVAGAAAYGLAPGTYQIAISWEDDAIGEEGVASETLSIDVPDNGLCYTINIPFLHPGYVMPECLALKMNVYIATPGADDLAYYASFPLAWIPNPDPVINNTSYGTSAKYGFKPGEATTLLLHRWMQLPLPGAGGDLSTYLDATRLAPQSASMPRGADAVRYVRGVMLSGGNIGNFGPSRQISYGAGSCFYGVQNSNDDELLIRVHGNTAQVPSATMDGGLDALAFNTLGAAGRAFPSAYQGIEVAQRSLAPTRNTIQIDRLLNRGAFTLSDPANYFAIHHERLRVTRPIFNRTRAAGTTPSTAPTFQNENQPVFYLQPRGQLAVADPGAPNRSSPLFIQFIDPNRGDDITAIGRVAGTGIICTRTETYSFAWYRNPGSEIPNLMNNEFGCVGANTMVEFDGGLAWISARGPVAIGGAGLQHIGQEIEEDFRGQNRRYQFDSYGMMRCAWGVHDAARGLVIWGLVSRFATHTIQYRNLTYTWGTSEDNLKSRFPCDEMLIWSYRANAFSIWRPPAGHEILWMRPLRDAYGRTWMSYLAADGRIYALDDAAHDTNHSDSVVEFTLPTAGNNTTTVTWTSPVTGMDGTASPARDQDLHLRVGMSVEFLNSNGQFFAQRPISSIQSVGASTEITLGNPVTWPVGTRLRVGLRPSMELVTTFFGGNKMKLNDVRIRYGLHGEGTANWRVSALKSDRYDDGPTAKVVDLSTSDLWEPLGEADIESTDVDGYRLAHVRSSGGGGCEGEMALRFQFTGTAQVRLSNIDIDVS